MTLLELKEKLATLDDEQLNQIFVVFNGDEESSILPQFMDISKEDMYYDHTDCIGDLEECKKVFGKNWEHEIEDYNKVPKGTISFLTEIN